MGKQRSRQLQDGRGTSNRNYRQEIGDKTQTGYSRSTRYPC